MPEVLKFLAALSFLTASCIGQGGECPSGWSKWKDEKCYLLETTYSTYSGAKELCHGNAGTLPTIKEEEQQTFLTNFIFNVSEVKIGVWIGATRTSGSETEFQWEVDGSKLDYTNWGPDSPSSIIERNCVAMQSRLSKMVGISAEPEDGKWKDVSCEAVNYAVCETIPSWSLDEIRRVLINTRKTLENTVETLQSTVEELQQTKQKLAMETERLTNESRKVENIQKNPVPIGFIYIEYHGQPAPQTLWPGVTWTDVTSTYAGLFFRALGGGSAGFGSVQNGDSPRFTNVGFVNRNNDNDYNWDVQITPGTWSNWLATSRDDGRGSNWQAHRFLVSNPEVRPKNAAIRIWKRQA